MGQIGILNVGAGDTKLTFDKNNPAERIRSARIAHLMLMRGDEHLYWRRCNQHPVWVPQAGLS